MPRRDHDIREGAQRGERLATKAKRLNGGEIGEFAQLGGVVLQCQSCQVTLIHSRSVVSHLELIEKRF